MLQRQLEYFKQMGFSGAHIHSRLGMATSYLGNEFMELVKACVNKEKMLIYLYVVVCGRFIRLTSPQNEIAFDSIVNQGMPFYGGNIEYTTEITTVVGFLKLKRESTEKVL